MKSNLTKLLNERAADLTAGGMIDINDLTEELLPAIRFHEPTTKADLLREVVKARVIVFLNQRGCFSVSKNQFISYEHANLSQISAVIGSFSKNIKGYKKMLKKLIKRRESIISGQMRMEFRESELIGLSEEKPIEELLKSG